MAWWFRQADSSADGSRGIEITAQRSDGKLVPIELRVALWWQDDERMVTAVLQDLSTRKQNDKERDDLTAQLHQAQKMEAIATFASGLAHDFNNILQGIVGCLSLARRPGSTPDEVRESLDQALGAAKRGSVLAGQLMSLARKQPINPVPLPVEATLRHSVALIRRLMTEDIVVDVSCEADDACVLADPVQLEQVLLNLAANARDAMPDGGSLTIHTDIVGREHPAVTGSWLAPGHDVPSEFVRIVVADDGTGMSTEVRTRALEPFFTTKKGQGTGLGLSTSYSIVSQLGGHLTIESTPDQGTTITLLMPRSHPTSLHEAAAPRARDEARFQGIAVLVEDEPLVRKTVRHYLDGLGFSTIEASTSEEAIKLFECSTHDISVLVTDVVLPHQRGTRLAERARQLRPGIKVLFISANAERLPAADASSGTLVKPFTREQLAEALERLLPTRVAEPGQAAGARVNPLRGNMFS